MTVIRFLTGYRSYNSGETAGFDAAIAAGLIAGGIAVAVEPDPVDPVEPDPVDPVEPDPVDPVEPAVGKSVKRGG